MSKSKKIGLMIGLIVAATVGVVILVSNIATAPSNKGTLTNQQCSGVEHSDYVIKITNSQVQPATVNARQCDTLTITNQDDQTREMIFGTHNLHTTYNGISKKSLNKNDSLKVTLVQTGKFRVHDHDNDQVKANFNVSAR